MTPPCSTAVWLDLLVAQHPFDERARGKRAHHDVGCGVWALLVGTRLTRGEEEAGRWELLLGGRLRRVDLLARCAGTLWLAATVIALGVGAGLVATGTDPAGAVLHAVSVFGTTAAFAGVGLLAAQLVPSRAAATGLASAVLAVCLLLRMLSDGIAELAWTAWLTPFGLAARTAKYADNRIEPLLVLLVFATRPPCVRSRQPPDETLAAQ